MPEMKFEAMACRPKPRPTPTAPPNTASAVRLTPITCRSSRNTTATIDTWRAFEATSRVR